MQNALKQILDGKQADYTPAAPAYPCLFLADFERNYYIEAYRIRMRGRDRYPIDHEEDTQIRAQAVYQSYGIFKSRPDWMEIFTGASRAWAERTNIVVQDGVLHYEDTHSGVRVPMHAIPLQTGDARLAPVNPGQSDLWDESSQLNDEDDVDELLPVVPARQMLASGEFDLPRRIVADYGDLTFLSTILDTPFSDAYSLLGFQGLMLIQHDRPRLFHHLLQRQLAASIQVMQAWASLGIHGVYVEEVFTGADMISPRSYDEFVYTYNQPYFQHMRSLDLFPIHYVCGDVIPRLRRIVAYDIAAVAVEESKKNFEIEIGEVVSAVNGKTVVFGNIDSVRFGLHGTQAEMAAEVRRQVQIGRQAAGFVVSTGSPFPLDTNPRQVDVLVESAHRV
jgi:uroporphyrinogen-III decarboxylase